VLGAREDAAGFVDDMFLLAWGKTLEESMVRSSHDGKSGQDGLVMHTPSGFALDNSGLWDNQEKRVKLSKAASHETLCRVDIMQG